MATLALFKTHSSSSSCGCYETASSLEDIKQYCAESSDSPSTPKRPVPRVSSIRNMFATATRRLRSLMSIVQDMRCISTVTSHDQESNTALPYPDSYSQEKNILATKFGTQCNHSTPGIVERIEVSPPDTHEQQALWTDLSENNAHIIGPSTNMAHKSSVLLNDESLRFASAFLPSMEPLQIWGVSTSASDSDQPPTTSRVRRHTSIRPGNIVQVPSVTDKGAIYLLSSQNETEWQFNAHLNTENSQNQKLFIAQAGGGAEQPAGHSRAFIMHKPGSEF